MIVTSASNNALAGSYEL